MSKWQYFKMDLWFVAVLFTSTRLWPNFYFRPWHSADISEGLLQARWKIVNITFREDKKSS